MNTASSLAEWPRPPDAPRAALQRAPDGRESTLCALEREPHEASGSVTEDLTFGCVDWYYYEEGSPGQRSRWP